jgi:hypothetical protein
MACYLLKPSGYCYDPPRRTLRKLFFLAAGCVLVFCVVLTQKSDYFFIHLQLAVFYKQGQVCLLRGTND